MGQFVGPMDQLGGHRTDCAEFLLKMAFLRTRAALEVCSPKEKMDSTRRARAHENVLRAPPRHTMPPLSNYFSRMYQLRAKRVLPARPVNFPPCDGQLVPFPRPLSFPSSTLGRPAAPFACGNLASLPQNLKGPGSTTWRRSRLERACKIPSCFQGREFSKPLRCDSLYTSHHAQVPVKLFKQTFFFPNDTHVSQKGNNRFMSAQLCQTPGGQQRHSGPQCPRHHPLPPPANNIMQQKTGCRRVPN